MQVLISVLTLLTAIALAAIAYLQWRTANAKTAIDLFDRRWSVYEEVLNAIARAVNRVNHRAENLRRFAEAEMKAFFLFGDDVANALRQVRDDLAVISTYSQIDIPTEEQLATLSKADERLVAFYQGSRILFERYMRIDQRVPSKLGPRTDGDITILP